MRRKQMQDVIDEMTRNQIGLMQTVAIKQHICVWCGKPVSVFHSKLNVKEFSISGFCQQCQDDTFGIEDTNE